MVKGTEDGDTVVRVTASRRDPTDGSSSPWLHHLLWEVSGQVAMLGNSVFRDSELTPALVGLLDEIHDEPGTTIARISRRVPSAPQSIRQVVERLERLGYIERRVGAGRGIGLFVTAAGASARRVGHRLERQLDDQLRTEVGDSTYADLHKLLTDARTRMGPRVAASRTAKQ